MRHRIIALVILVAIFQARPSYAQGSASPSPGHQPITGRLYESLPGGNTDFSSAYIVVYSLQENGYSDPVADILPCAAASDSFCIKADGSFQTQPLALGRYRLAIQTWYHLPVIKLVNSAASPAAGEIAMVRMPLQVTATLGDIPPGGGQVPVYLRAVSTWWNIALPATELYVSFYASGISQSSPYRFNSQQLSGLKDRAMVWPANTYEVPDTRVGTIPVPPGAPVGSEFCVDVQVALSGDPTFVVANAFTCGSKRSQ